MATANLGRVGFVNKGTYSGSTAYKVNDVVVYNSGTYACIQANTGQAPTNTSYWQNWVADNAVHNTGDETIAGVKTFSSSPIVPNATTAAQAIAYGQAVKNTGDETIAGVKTFSSSPISSATQSTAVNALTRKDYVDGLDSANVKLTGDETIAGVKTFSDGVKVQNQNVSPFSGFKNYIINGRKTINQRGTTSTDNSYNHDRWYKAGNNWFQGIEGDNNLINGKTYTLSWDGVATASYYVGTATRATINAQSFTPIANGGSFTLTISEGQNLWIKFSSDATGSTFNFVQLEEGAVATPFENRPYGLELSLCQRYYELSPRIASLCIPESISYNGCASHWVFKQTKRITPTIIIITNTGTKTAMGQDLTTNGCIFTPATQSTLVSDYITLTAAVSAEL